MHTRRFRRHHGRTAGFTIIELCIAMGIVSAVLATMLAHMQREASHVASAVKNAARAQSVSQLILKLERAFEFAQGARPFGWALEDIGNGAAESVRVDRTDSFPNRGALLVSAGSAWEEYIDYDGFDAVTGAFQTTDRGALCGSASNHFAGEPVQWAGLAHPIENQVDPLPNEYDGIASEAVGDQYFRGRGTGFAYRTPVRLPGQPGFFGLDGRVTWGASVDGDPTATGWSCVSFEPRSTVLEAAEGRDLNNDGDLEDSFDLGRLEARSWDGMDSTRETVVGLCPPILLQETCNPGSDLDGDGNEDPIFLFDPAASRLRVRLFAYFGDAASTAPIRRVEEVFFLRNGTSE